jgi:hypothetical protein
MNQEPHMIDLGKINALRKELLDQTNSRAAVPRGAYRCRVVDIRTTISVGDQDKRLVAFELTTDGHEGKRIEARLKGNQLRFVEDAKEKGTLLEIDVFVKRLDDGREFSNVNIETIRLAGTVVPGGTADEREAGTLSSQGMGRAVGEEPAAEEEQFEVTEFVTGFRIVGELESRRTLVTWREEFEAAAQGREASGGGAAFLSAYVFQEMPLAKHVAANAGSMAKYAGPAYAPWIVFEIDGKDSDDVPADAVAQHDAQNLVAILLELGVPLDDVLVFFSGGRGFHVLIPATLAGARPARNFADVAGVFCASIAEVAVCSLDMSLYRKLQPLRSPNSRHPGTGLYKVRLSIEQLFGEPIERIREYAAEPHPFTPADFSGEPCPTLATRWREAEEAVRRKAVAAATAKAGGENPFIYQNTWAFLINGAPEGSRAMETFKAAINLAAFENVKDLVRALLQRPTALSGFPMQEAEKHIDGALQRART